MRNSSQLLKRQNNKNKNNMETLLKEKIVGLYADYKELDSIVKAKNKEIANLNTSAKDLIDGKSIEDTQKILTHMYVDTVLYNKDLQICFFTLVNNIETYNELSEKALPEEILEFYGTMKTWVPRRMFMIEKGDLVETETGLLESERAKFLESDFFKQILEKTKEAK